MLRRTFVEILKKYYGTTENEKNNRKQKVTQQIQNVIKMCAICGNNNRIGVVVALIL